MNSTTMAILGLVKMKHPTSNYALHIEARGFDVFGFFFPILRLLLSNMYAKAFITLLISCTIIGIPITCWYVGFNFRRMHFEHLLGQGWTVMEEKQSTAAPAAA